MGGIGKRGVAGPCSRSLPSNRLGVAVEAFGPDAETALRQYQTDNGLGVDGLVRLTTVGHESPTGHNEVESPTGHRGTLAGGRGDRWLRHAPRCRHVARCGGGEGCRDAPRF